MGNAGHGDRASAGKAESCDGGRGNAVADPAASVPSDVIQGSASSCCGARAQLADAGSQLTEASPLATVGTHSARTPRGMGMTGPLENNGSITSMNAGLARLEEMLTPSVAVNDRSRP